MKKATLFAAATALLGAVWVSGATVFAETRRFSCYSNGRLWQ